MIGLVLDANILVSANLKPGGLEALIVSLGLNRKVRLYISKPILAEYERVLLYPRLKFDPREIATFLELFRRAAVLVKPKHVVTSSVDEADNRFLECAETADVAFLITGNQRHFPKRWKGAEVVNARQLLGLIGTSFLK